MDARCLRRILAKSSATIGYLKTNAGSWTENSQETVEEEDLYIEENGPDYFSV